MLRISMKDVITMKINVTRLFRRTKRTTPAIIITSSETSKALVLKLLVPGDDYPVMIYFIMTPEKEDDDIQESSGFYIYWLTAQDLEDFHVHVKTMRVVNNLIRRRHLSNAWISTSWKR
ncbi:hypothetical protein MKW98_000268 [Papaver atlanticum]|uniref:Uncharacterized protein n=1 Tax=Papaver atlanticum TaxID=357466 RepID=A0AAD4X5L2_9MAGN|nr:hypothetical protein MKW98_000268 [Papaver atlanticum]